MRAPKILLAALAVAPVLLSAEVALGWSPLDGTQPVWATLPHTYRVNQNSIPSSIPDGVQSIDFGYAQWMMPSCTSYTAQNLGNTTSGANYNDGLNVLRWINTTWPQMYGPVNQVIGVTLPVYFSGPIADADISFNGVGFCWNNTGTGGCVDTKSIATHEEGHSLGLGHSQASGSTMEAAYGGGTSIATIEQDDIDGVCTLYPGTGPGSSGVASSSAASSGSGGGQTCMECTQSESSGSCASQYNACTSSQACNDFYSCAIACNGNQTCVTNCANTYPQGAQLYNNFRACICGVCVMECAMECGGGSSSSAVASSSAANTSSSSGASVGSNGSVTAGVGGSGSGNAAGAGGEGGSSAGGANEAEGSCSCSMQSRGIGAGALTFLMALGAALARPRRKRRT